MQASRIHRPQSLRPGEIELLGQVFEQLLEERQLPNCGEQAEALAARLLSIFQSGERNVERLKMRTMHS
ncbi:hypothetical protein PZN02_001544 [Sinorhizobium garamanticum]|uniref:Uncharacterized protein n=1 Tax=Sinorhizobium garamanticum TaxID=680247 RepID=A0ABY8DH63_9HYPH|nr:hypothetical protein [Sinorhizobium garamanticum]WEX89012.1 hypothetical protein PZN02_001544 [Sinorhizobium garamanticum]